MDSQGLPQASIGLVTWNSAPHIPRCLDSIQQQTYPNLELVVVDNASSDGSAELVRERVPGVNLIQNPSNEGYCRAHNMAIRASRGAYYLALNPDVEMLPGFVRALVSALETRPEFGSATGKMWQASSESPPILDGAGLFLDRRRHQYLRGRGEPDTGQYDRPEEVFGADGAACLYRRATLEDLQIEGQYFDEGFFTYMEDVDLAWRARLLGRKCWYEPAAAGYHARTFKPGERRAVPRELRRLAVRNRYLMLLKNEGAEEFRRDWWRILAYDLGIWAYDLGIWAYIILLEQSSLGAAGLVKKDWARTRAWRRRIWRQVKAQPSVRLSWFR